MTQRKVDLPAQWRDATFRSSSFNKSDNTISLVWTTGAAVTRRGPDGGYYEEELIVTKDAVHLDRLNNGAPLLNSHRDGKLEHVIGSVVPGSARVEGGKGYAKVRLSTALGDADNVTKIRDGIIRNISVGYVIHRVEIVERERNIPIWKIVSWEPLELSAVPIPADPGAQIRAGQRAGQIDRSTASMTVLGYWSVAAVRSRMLSDQRRLGLLTDRKFDS